MSAILSHTAIACRNCRYWGHMGLCRAQSGNRSDGTAAWAQTVTTEHDDSCGKFQPALKGSAQP